jgi:ribonuclease Z
MYSNWLWHRPLQLVVDAGEGLQVALGPSVYGPTVLAITHGHSDHVLGLPGFIGARRFGKGAQDKPLTVLHPEGSRGVRAVRSLLAEAYPGLDFPVVWHAMTPGDEWPLGKGRTLQACAVRHTAGEPSLAYRVIEARHRLKPEFTGLPQADIEARARRGERDAMTEAFSHILFAHSGDAMAVGVEEVRGADLLVHDATFLREEDRRELIHATTREVFALAREATVSRLVLQHLSIRYDRGEAMRVLRTQLGESEYAGEAWLLDEGEFVGL